MDYGGRGVTIPSLPLQKIKNNEEIILTPEGSWRLWSLAGYFKALQNFSLLENEQKKKVVIDLSRIADLDTGGALLLLALKKRLENKKISIVLDEENSEVQDILDLVQEYPLTLKSEQKPLLPYLLFLLRLGEAAVSLYFFTMQLISFFGEVFVGFVKSFSRRSSFRFTAFCAHLQDVGVNAVPIISLISFLIGVVLSYQGITQLRRFGAEIFTVNLLALGILREVGILITSIVIAGRSGSAFTAQIGTMVLNEEVDAMRIMGLDPVNVLVIPRLFALIIALPLLTFLSDILGLIGGAFITNTLMDLSYIQFIDQLKLAVTPKAFWVGIIKAPIFAFLIALIGCFEGLNVKGSAESVGRQTTRSVVEAIFLVIVADAGFSVLFSYLGI